ncbi:class F sortase [Hamadaea tsunoensis]|uniref:class F sortase n=1 Tax=Hamadaea tsunoensis TaxID=53368 RepID=UPI000684D0A8|nr:class F sortase [Hamadaea tsunoensis]
MFASGARAWLAVLAAGCALFVGATVVACRSQPPATVGASTVASLEASPPASGPAVPVHAGSLPSAAPQLPPVRLSIAAIAVDVAVDPVGLDARSGDFDVPPSVSRVGWYRYGPGLEATTGSIVIAGHVDSAQQGTGAFFRLRELTAGDIVMVTGQDGQQHEFAVIAREEYAKTRIPLAKYFARDGATRLTLITCGGPFDAATRHYRDNIVITAIPR